MRYLSFLAATLAAATFASAGSIENAQQAIGVADESPIVQDQCLIELSPGETLWVSEEEKWELKRVRARPSPMALKDRNVQD